MKNEALIVAGVALAVLIAAAYAKKKVGDAVAGAGGLQGAVADLVYGTADGVLSGAVIGAGKVVGIPATNRTQCDIDLANGDLWNASFSCPAGTFVGGVWDTAKGAF